MTISTVILNVKQKEFGAIGIGAMIIFIALIIVAGVAASIIIQTSNTVQLQAMKTGVESLREVAGGISIFDIEGFVNKTGSTYYNITYLAITIRLRPGTDYIDLNNSYILMTDGLKKVLLRYNYGNSSSFITKTSTVGSVFNLLSSGNWLAETNEYFAIAVMQDYDSSMKRFQPIMNQGDKAILLIRCSSASNGAFEREIPERTDVTGQIVPERGSPGVIAFTTPMSYSTIIYDLQ